MRNWIDSGGLHVICELFGNDVKQLVVIPRLSNVVVEASIVDCPHRIRQIRLAGDQDFSRVHSVLILRQLNEEIDAGGIRVYDPLPVVYHCPEDWTKVRDMIRGLGRQDAETLLAEHGDIVIRDDICNREYRFTAEDVALLFAESEGNKLN